MVIFTGLKFEPLCSGVVGTELNLMRLYLTEPNQSYPSLA